MKLCIAITDVKMCTCCFEGKYGVDRRRGQQGEGQAQHGGIICVLHNFLVGDKL